ncbi:hypothetical protein K458DRAFT_954 [Lentithecium fluviatile CBS 122367]|uniref:Uncharacterized protein n=1 Tax=Lentithecium fluviatile CBS 122367 TaxID=1168545 RepID=A0A6G1JLN1_9PLEO|nr:hypothetical protein K458DRAFT_954 [Lentithecium fluviatile CBS 122367]
MAALDLFESMFRDSFRRPGDLGDYYLDQLVLGQASQLPPEQIQAFADRFRDRAIEIVGMLQLQAENNTPQANISPDLPTSGNDTRAMEAELDLSTSPHNQAWLGQFPVPEQMLADPFEIATPVQQVYSHDFFNIGDWLVSDEPPDKPSSSLRSSLSSPVVS